MKRRKVFSTIGLGVFGIGGLPTWANAWTPAKIKNDSLNLNLAEVDLLVDLTEIIIPETSTPGARTLEISKFIKTMISDLYSKEDQQKFKSGMVKIEEIAKVLYGKSYLECSKEQKLHLLKGLELSSDKDQKWFFDVTKRLCVQAYTSSEYYMVNIAKFEFAPARYYGCIPLT